MPSMAMPRSSARCSSGTASAGCSIAARSPGSCGARPRPLSADEPGRKPNTWLTASLYGGNCREAGCVPDENGARPVIEDETEIAARHQELAERRFMLAHDVVDRILVE